MVFRRHGLNLLNGLIVKLDGALRGFLHGRKALPEMEEAGQVVEGRRSLFLKTGKRLFAALNDVLFQSGDLSPEGLRLFLQSVDGLLKGIFQRGFLHFL